MTACAHAAGGFRHEALLYRGGPDGFAREIAPMAAATLGEGGTAAIAAPPDRLERLRAQLGDHERLQLIDMFEIGLNPARIIPAWRDIADAALAEGRPLLGVGEPVWAGRADPELVECHRHEALINVAFANDPSWRLVCPYDVDALAAHVVEDALATHPAVLEEDGCRHADVDGARAFRALERPLDPVPAGAVTLRFGREDLKGVRALAAEHARAAGLGREATGDLLLAASEIATNSLRHGGGAGTFDVWHEPGAVVCQSSDAGRIADPMVGRQRPGLEFDGGRGMWIVNQVCALVQVRSSERGTTVRVTVR